MCLSFGKFWHVFLDHENLAAVLGGIQIRGSLVVNRRPGRGISMGAYCGCHLHAFAMLGVSVRLCCELISSVRVIFDCWFRGSSAKGIGSLVVHVLVISCCMSHASWFDDDVAAPASPFPTPETPVFTESPVSPPSPWCLVSSGSPLETVWYDSDIEDVHCVSGGATSNRESRELSSLGNLGSVSR